MAWWLMKSEPDAYSWDDLIEEKKGTWDGVRNYAARLHLQAMKKGDTAFFYHSNEGKEIVGIAKIVETAFPDPTDETGKWTAVRVSPVKPFKKFVTLADIKANPKLAEMLIIKQSRLSVAPVSDAHAKIVLAMGETTA